MRTDTGVVFRIEDYKPSDYTIPRTDIVFRLDPDKTSVRTRLTIRRREGVNSGAPLVLDGDGLALIGLTINGSALVAMSYDATPERLVLRDLPVTEEFEIAVETEIAPAANTALMGLYRSNGVYCTQCEAEGFRRITYFLDRPDILSVYDVRIEARRGEAPLLLSNGNPGKSGDLEDGWHFAEWHDPHPKPSYLFALVAGDLDSLTDRYTTSSGRSVDLAIYVEHGKTERATYAMDALKRSMRWDEEVFGLEYDLDVFNVVAVSDFNMGAMENKGLNIFNDKYVLADEETATDTDFANIETIVAHEYFHNWTGNRITCRDWFQLCLKEGLTVFRDHEFSADQRSRAVRRIAEVRTLKAHQFPEDQGPLAHPVRPRRYREINNFYTATVYEKGSEVVRMIRTILGGETFRRGMSLYIERHDGEAATIEQFLKAFEDASGRDLSQFALWYHQAGTPTVSVTSSHDAETRRLSLDMEQSLQPTPGESRKRLMHIPLAFALYGPDGRRIEPSSASGAEIANGVIHLVRRHHKIVFEGVQQRPAVSLNRDFSAPVQLVFEQSAEDRLLLARHESDLFSRWQSLTAILVDTLIAATRSIEAGIEPDPAQAAVFAIGEIAADESLEPAFRALALNLPAEADIAREIGATIDPDAIHKAREHLASRIAATHRDRFAQIRTTIPTSGPFSPDAASAGRRALANVLLDYLSVGDLPSHALDHYRSASNMTDRAAALSILAHRFAGSPQALEALFDFETRYADDALVMDKWFQIQATVPGPTTLERVRELMTHRVFSLANPNRVRALLGTFSSGNQTGFHRADGAGYRLLAETVLGIEARNPQLASRLALAFRSWRSLEPGRKAKAGRSLEEIAAYPGLSADLRDIVERMLA